VQSIAKRGRDMTIYGTDLNTSFRLLQKDSKDILIMLCMASLQRT
jgi:hypothetical protein